MTRDIARWRDGSGDAPPDLNDRTGLILDTQQWIQGGTDQKSMERISLGALSGSRLRW